MANRPLAQEDLAVLAQALGIQLSPDRLAAILPEVQRLQVHARRLRELPLQTEEPAVRLPAP